jgi:hypothetical protein
LLHLHLLDNKIGAASARLLAAAPNLHESIRAQWRR